MVNAIRDSIVNRLSQSGVTPVTQGGTGTNTQFTQGSVIFAGANGVYSQDNADFNYDPTTNTLVINGPIFGGGNLNIGANTVFSGGVNTGFVQVGTNSALAWSTRSQILSPSDGLLNLRNNANSDYSDVAAKNVKISTLGAALYVKEGTGGFSGGATLVSGVATITITGLATTDRAYVQRSAVGGTVGTGGYTAACTTNTLTITSIQSAGTTQTLDTSTLNYFITRQA